MPAFIIRTPEGPCLSSPLSGWGGHEPLRHDGRNRRGLALGPQEIHSSRRSAPLREKPHRDREYETHEDARGDGNVDAQTGALDAYVPRQLAQDRHGRTRVEHQAQHHENETSADESTTDELHHLRLAELLSIQKPGASVRARMRKPRPEWNQLLIISFRWSTAGRLPRSSTPMMNLTSILARATARSLGITRECIYNKLKRYELQ